MPATLGYDGLLAIDHMRHPRYHKKTHGSAIRRSVSFTILLGNAILEGVYRGSRDINGGGV